MDKTTNSPKSLDEMTIKEALLEDVAELQFRSTVIMDPAPAPMIPITPIVIGKKIIKGTKKAFGAIKNTK